MSKIRCMVCNEVLESTFRHDFVMCKCENKTFVDGGNDYCRVGGVDMQKIEFIVTAEEHKKNTKEL